MTYMVVWRNEARLPSQLSARLRLGLLRVLYEVDESLLAVHVYNIAEAANWNPAGGPG